MEMAVESMEMAPGEFPISVGCRNRDFCPPNLLCDGGGAAELYLGKHRLI
jgi:hypothetical protein